MRGCDGQRPLPKSTKGNNYAVPNISNHTKQEIGVVTKGAELWLA